MAAYQVLLLNTAIPQIQAAQSGDTYVVPRDIAFSTVASFAAGTEALPSLVATGDVNTGFWFPAADTIAASTGGTRRLTLNSSGNLGLGVPPSAWGSVSRAMQFQNGVSIFSNTSGVGGLGNNVYSNPGTDDYYIATGFATRYYQFNGTHVWNTAASGTADDAISFTQAMTLDASGNLLVGTTSPAGGASKFNVYGSQSYDSVNATIANWYSGGTQIGFIGQGNYAVSGASSTGISFASQSSMSFATGGQTERARITSNGEVLFGLNAQTNTPANGFVFQNLGTTSSQVLIGHSNSSGSGTYYEAYFYDSTVIGSVTQNGTTGVLYNITSDYRLKTVTGPVTDAGSRIDALEPVEYTWKANGSSARGFLAHKFQEVYPNSVTGQKDAIDAEGNPVYQNMQASTSEVIADLVAELQSLRARVAQLEAK